MSLTPRHHPRPDGHHHDHHHCPALTEPERTHHIHSPKNHPPMPISDLTKPRTREDGITRAIRPSSSCLNRSPMGIGFFRLTLSSPHGPAWNRGEEVDSWRMLCSDHGRGETAQAARHVRRSPSSSRSQGRGDSRRRAACLAAPGSPHGLRGTLLAEISCHSMQGLGRSGGWWLLNRARAASRGRRARARLAGLADGADATHSGRSRISRSRQTGSAKSSPCRRERDRSSKKLRIYAREGSSALLADRSAASDTIEIRRLEVGEWVMAATHRAMRSSAPSRSRRSHSRCPAL